MRIGTWNLKLCPSSTSVRGQAIASWKDDQDAELWLLTEVHRDWPQLAAVSPPRRIANEVKRWAGIQTTLPLGQLRTTGDPTHAGEEGLCLARLHLGDGSTSVLVACSVLPWKGAGQCWPGLPSGQLEEFRHVLDHHVARIHDERRDGEPVIWGGDFNQPLVGPFWGSTKTGAELLREAFDKVGVIPLTENTKHLNGETHAIDHVAVSRDLIIDGAVAEVHRPTVDGSNLSDHAAYTAEIRDLVAS